MRNIMHQTKLSWHNLTRKSEFFNITQITLTITLIKPNYSLKQLTEKSCSLLNMDIISPSDEIKILTDNLIKVFVLKTSKSFFFKLFVKDHILSNENTVWTF